MPSYGIICAPGHAVSRRHTRPPARRRVGRVEALLLQRHCKSKFAAGDYVFAGGKVEADDIPDDVEAFCRGLTAEDAAARLGGALERARRWATGWERSARHSRKSASCSPTRPDGGVRQLTADNRERFEAYRSACQTLEPARSSTCFAPSGSRSPRTASATSPTGSRPRRTPSASTRASSRPSRRPARRPVADGHEIVDVRWLTADETLEAIRRKEISLRTPTIKNLEIVGTAAMRGRGRRGGGGGGGTARGARPSAPASSRSTGGRSPVLPGDPRWY